MRTLLVLAEYLTIASIASASPLPDTTFLEPPDGRIYHGVQTAFGSHNAYLAMLGPDSSIHPAVRGFFFSVPGTRSPSLVFNGLRSFFASADSFGFIPEISFFLVASNVDPRGATDSIIAVSTAYDPFLDSVLTICRSYGRRMFVRIGGEFNGPWNGGGYHPYYYVTAFRKIADMFTARGMRDSIAVNWCYEPDGPNDFDSVGVNGPLWYPGDAYVDWFGLDVFDAAHFDQSLPNERNGRITLKGKSERFLGMARSKGKPVFLNETSAKGVTITADSTDSFNDWRNWFAKFWVFLDNHPEIKGYNYLDVDWENNGYPGWGDARIQNSPWVTAWYRQEMRRPRYIHLRQGTTPVHEGPPLPGDVVLEQNYPNPFNPVTVIRFDVQREAWVRLAVYDLLGREVAVLVEGMNGPGSHTVTFDASNLASGVFVVRLTAGDAIRVRRMVLAR
jgi:hypothetical protein